MTSLKNQMMLRLLLSKKRTGTTLQQGFTLVELIVVIVIVAILSAIALPSLIGQTSRAKATECTSKMGAIMSQVGAENLLSQAAASALLTSEIAIANANSTNCLFANGSATAPEYVITALGQADLAGKYAGASCVNGTTGIRETATDSGDSGIALTSTATAALISAGC